jgi:Flagellar motor switch protein
MSRPTASPGPFIEAADGAFVWWESAQLAEIAGCLQAAWSKWAQDWITGGVPRGGECACTLAHDSVDHAAVRWDPVGTRKQAAAWIEVRYDPVIRLQEAIFGAGRHSPAPPRHQEGMAHSVASRAWAALAGTLRGCLSLDADPGQTSPDHAVFKPWSGCVLLSLASGQLSHSLLLNAQCVRALLRLQPNPTRAPERARQAPIVVSVEQALADHKLQIQVELTGCELDLGTLQGLRVGDIVPLPHSLDEPLLVSTPACGAFCTGFLGRQAGSKAIELLREPSPLHRPTATASVSES